MNILLAIDDSPFSRHMLAWLGACGDPFLSRDHRYGVVHAQTPAPRGLKVLVDDSELERRRVMEADAVFDPVRTFMHHHGVHATFFAAEGNPSDVIIEHAQRLESDLIVMGSHGRSTAGQWALGSVVSRVLARTSVPVLVVPPPGAAGTSA
ncbi:MAG TPA: universal stress protein [Rhizobacter sp.]